MMRMVLTAELALALVACVLFAVLQARTPRPASRLGRRTWWQLLTMAVVAATEFAVLLLVLHRVHWPWWVLAAVYGAVDVVMVRWLLLRWRTRQEET
jgi:hypothetical protein